MYRRILVVLCSLLILATLTSCWSSKEIEDLALYAGLALDIGELSPTEQKLEDKGATYYKKNKITATVQMVPANSVGGVDNQGNSSSSAPYMNVTGTGDSVLEIFRQYSILRERPIIGHHLKVIVISSELLKQQKINQLLDFVLRDNDIRPSTMVFLSQGRAADTMVSKQKNEIPAFHIRDMLRNQKRTSKVLDPVILSKMDALMASKRSFALQNLVTANDEVEFSGAGVIKGDTGNWVGTLNQEDTECLTWLSNGGQSGVIKTYDWSNEPITYELKSMKSKITSKVDGDNLSFDVNIKTEGRLIETWNVEEYPAATHLPQKVEKLFKKRLEQMMESLFHKLQSDYKADAAGFSTRLSIQEPALWKKLEDHWDEEFSRTPIHVTVDLKITDFGSFTQ
ncbi:Ger(x)C family spore germination protein [Paenibacillus sp. FSL R7-0337]|uniref:Ger(x)C family spore germination protein n=1 Tax=Paenibacillus sp. FSL R7-0337 TaxID=1926588 RepID=UPI00096C5A9C|nr:Ger(x)C family spore germination protein [Paenibacillus sp. FSL R7-0337]OMF95433.1 spore gernimation protein GerC [Paenibacillus sp. FSL R7-0337]